MQIACGKCKYYFTTHDVARPWGCHKFGFKSKNLPNQEIRRTTGMDCAYFSSKTFKRSQFNLLYDQAFLLFLCVIMFIAISISICAVF